MPYSDNLLDKKIQKIIKSFKFKKYLDIGAGAGKFGKLIKNIHPNSFIEAVEIDSCYINDFALDKIYDSIYLGDAAKIADNFPNYHTEVVIFGDVIEHMKKSDGIDLLNYFMYRAHKIIIIIPSKYIQYSWSGHDSEAHRSVWSKKDIDLLGKYKFYKINYLNLFIIDGYLSDKNSIIDSEVQDILKDHKCLE